jgi:hypothetical protein
MSYAVAIVTYAIIIFGIPSYSLIHGLLAGGGSPTTGFEATATGLFASLPMLVIYVSPLVLVFSRWRVWRADHEDLLPALYKHHSPLGHKLGMLLTWIGHLLLFVALSYGIVIAFSASPESAEALIGCAIGIGFAALIYFAAMLCIETSIRRWSRRNAA